VILSGLVVLQLQLYSDYLLIFLPPAPPTDPTGISNVLDSSGLVHIGTKQQADNGLVPYGAEGRPPEARSALVFGAMRDASGCNCRFVVFHPQDARRYKSEFSDRRLLPR